VEALYLPANDRRGAGFAVSSTLIRLGETSIAGVLQEFVHSRFTPNFTNRSPSQLSGANWLHLMPIYLSLHQERESASSNGLPLSVVAYA
jgi:hypothetical protein